MNEFLAQLSSPSWWLGIVVVSFLINLASAYVKSPLDAVLMRISTKWSARSVLAKQRRAALVASLAGDRHKQLLFLAAEMRCRLREIMYCVLAALVLIAVAADPILSPSVPDANGRLHLKIVVFCFFLLLMASGLSQRFAAVRISSLVKDAQKFAGEC